MGVRNFKVGLLVQVGSEQRGTRQNAGALVSDQQMRLAVPRFPVDRYLVDSSKNFEMVEIDDDLWKSEPVLRPEDEIILRKLHDMLQSTADDLKELTGQLTEYHKPPVRVKTLPVPLDDGFNEKIHIEEVVNAKFHGHKHLENSNLNFTTNQNRIHDETFTKTSKNKPVLSNQTVQATSVAFPKKKNLSISRTRTLQIEDAMISNIPKDKAVQPKKLETVSYNEVFYKEEAKPIESPRTTLQIQQMPSINIRSELREQKVLQLDINPQTETRLEKNVDINNVAVIEMHHEAPILQSIANNIQTKYHQQSQIIKKPSVKKITIMSTSESSESSNNINSAHQHKSKLQKTTKSALRDSPKTSVVSKKNTYKKDSTDPKNIHFNLDEWKKKLNIVYGRPLSSRKNKTSAFTKSSLKKTSPKSKSARTASNYVSFKSNSQTDVSNNAAYVPYSQLTLGGVRVSDIEREISDGAIKEDIPLSPILDKILSNRDSKDQKHKNSEILSTSDENLLREVLNIGHKINNTLSKRDKEYETVAAPEEFTKEESASSKDVKDNDSYDDDFEEVDKSDISPSVIHDISPKNTESETNDNQNISQLSDNGSESASEGKDKNATFIKEPNLSLKDSVDIFEFIHSIETQENATQSHTTRIISLKETQTSPKNETEYANPVHNEVCLPNNPFLEVEKMFKLEKELIKKLIVEEYGDLIEKNTNKPSSSNVANEFEKNIIALQKDTQTSPLHVKSIMTSPKQTKTRTTSPFTINVTIDHQTSPVIFVNDKELKLDVIEDEKSNGEDIGISINLSSPRFSLRLPQTSREVLSNLENVSNQSSVQKKEIKKKEVTIKVMNSSTSTETEISSSEISSLGEIKFLKLRRRLRKSRLDTETSSSSLTSHSSLDNSFSILPMRSEGEVSFKHNNRRRAINRKKADDEKSLGQL